MTTRVLHLSPLWLVLGFAPVGICAAQSLTAVASFESFDTNRDGVVSKYEYDSDAVFASMDSDHNNRVSAAELEAILGPQAAGWPSAADRIRRADRNEDGELSDEELRRTAETRFEWLDRNRDDNLDLAEMQSGFGIPAPPKPWRP